MTDRTARKVVARFATQPRGYSITQIKTAHQTLGREIDPHRLALWEKASAERTAMAEGSAADNAARHGRTQAKRSQNITRLADEREKRDGIRAEKQAQAKRDAEIQAEYDKNIAKANADALAAKAAPTETVVQVGAVEAKIEAGDDGVIGTKDDVVTLQKAGTAEKTALAEELVLVTGLIELAESRGEFTTKLMSYRNALTAVLDDRARPDVALPTVFADLSVADLKALCKVRGLKGYSKLKKDDLLALLDGL